MKLKKITLLCVSLVAVALGGLLAPSAAHADPEIDAYTPYWIKFRHSSKCAVNGPSTEDGTQYRQWTCQQFNGQLWNFEPIGTDGVGRTQFQIRNRYTGKCMHTSSYVSGAVVWQLPCVGGRDRSGKWVFFRYSSTPAGWYYLVNDWGAQCLTVAENTLQNGGPLIAWSCGLTAANQMVVRIPA